MATEYLTAHAKAAAHERAYEFSLAAKAWKDAHKLAAQKDKDWCESRRDFCQKFGGILENKNGHN